jgi:uncharacterized protein with GYD domain
VEKEKKNYRGLSDLTTEETIDYIISNFKFDKVHAYMVLTNWTWQGASTPPTIKELKKHAEYCLWEAVRQGRESKNQQANTGNGGFIATYNVFDTKECLKLAFTVTTGSNY